MVRSIPEDIKLQKLTRRVQFLAHLPQGNGSTTIATLRTTRPRRRARNTQNNLKAMRRMTAMRTKRLIRQPKLRSLRNENLNRNPPRKQNQPPPPRNLGRKRLQRQSHQRWRRAGGENQRKEKTRTTQSRLQKTRKFLPIIPYSVRIILSLVSFLILNSMIRCYYECGFTFAVER